MLTLPFGGFQLNFSSLQQVVYPNKWIRPPRIFLLDKPTNTYYIREGDLGDGRPPDHDLQETLCREWRAIPGPVLKLKQFTTEGGLSQSQIKGQSLVPDPHRIHLVEQSSDSWLNTYYRVSAFQCPSCPYGSENLPHSNHGPHPSASAVDSSHHAEAIKGGVSICHLEMLNDDVLSKVAPYLPPRSLLYFMDAYPRMRCIVSQIKLIPHRELSCTLFRRSVRDVILGIRIGRYGEKTQLKPNFEWVSMEAFKDYQGRFAYFLPLAFNHNHFLRAEGYIWSSINTIEAGIVKRHQKHGMNSREEQQRWAGERLETTRTKGVWKETQSPSERSISVLLRMMEGIVESLFKAPDKRTKGTTARQHTRPFSKFTLRQAPDVNEAIISYALLFHLSLCLSRSDRELFHQVVHCVQTFKDEPVSKSAVPNHEFPCELLITAMIVDVLAPITAPHDHVQMSLIIGPFLEEVLIRDSISLSQRAPVLMELETGESEFRAKVAFRNSKSNFRKIMFNILFLRIFSQFYIGEAGLSKLDSDFGFLEDEAIDVLVQGVKDIQQVNSWSRFFRFINYANGEALSGVALSEMLRDAMRTGSKRGYHTSGEVENNSEY